MIVKIYVPFTGTPGATGSYYQNGGPGGTAYAAVLGNTVYNYSIMTGGAGGAGGYGASGGSGGTGVNLSLGTVWNTAGSGIIGGAGGAGSIGHIYGGNGGGGGVGVSLSPGTTLLNVGSITGGAGGTGGFAFIELSGSGGGGGAGVTMYGGALTNVGSIAGGAGGTSNGGHGGNGGSGGAGVSLVAGTVTNGAGHSITGGAGGAGGFGASGGFGNEHFFCGNGGSGGVGVSLAGGATLTNYGSITGGAGGAAGNGYGYGGRFYSGTSGGGGAGVYLNGGTLTTLGTISGGAGGTARLSNGSAGDAVQFGTVASTLIVDPGAVFNGQVAANVSVNDVLELSGTQAGGTPITLGSQFTGFTTLDFESGAAWTVDVNTGAASSSPGLAVNGFTPGDKLDFTNVAPKTLIGDLNATTNVLTTSDGTFNFSGTFTGESFAFSSDGSGGTDISLVTGSAIFKTVRTTVRLGSTAHPSPLTITNIGVVSPTVAGATGVVSTIAGNSLTNNGAIKGSTGSNSSAGGSGGVGVNFNAAGTVTNTGSITGGNGGTGSAGAGGHGGVGVSIVGGVTLTNSGSIAGGTGGAGSTSGGAGGAGVSLNGGTLITSGTISGGLGGPGITLGAIGDAVKFGTVASTLIVDPGAVFIDKVVGNASVHDVLELSGTQSGGTAITLGTEFTNFSTLDFASGAAWTADATVADLTQHPLTLNGFGPNDTLDITNLGHTGATASFNTTTDLLTISKGATTIHLQFDSAFTGEHFVLTANGSGTNVTLAPGLSATLAGLAHDVMNFVSDDHRALLSDQFVPVHGLESGLLTATSAAALDHASYGFASHGFTDHGLAHATFHGCKA